MPNNKIFVDSNFFIALFNPQDSQHEKSLKFSSEIKKDNLEIVTSNLIFLEVVTIFSQRVSRQKAIILGSKFLDGNYLKIIHVDEILQNLSWRIFQEIRGKNVSFVDCSIIAILKFFNMKNLLTFDVADFSPLKKKFGFKMYD